MSEGAQKTEKDKALKKLDASRPATSDIQPQPSLVDVASALQKASADPPTSPRPSDVIALQQTAGNRAVRHLLQKREEQLEVHGSRTHPEMVQRIGAYPFLVPSAASSPAEMGATPAGQVEALSAEVQQEHQTHVTAGRFQEALDLVAQAMVRAGQLNRVLLQTVANPGRSTAACQGTDCFVVDEGVPGANTIFCGQIAVGDRNIPNPRIRVNPSHIGSLPLLQSTLLHEFRHVEQEHSDINQPGGIDTGGHQLNCNDPGEMDAYLTEVEHSYQPGDHVLEAFARAYVTNRYLAPEQRGVFQSRLTSAEAKVNRMYNTTIEWRTNNHVQDYQQASESLIARHERRLQERDPGTIRPFYFHHPMAPLNDDTPREGTRGGGTPG